jgi:hypothetical protein
MILEKLFRRHTRSLCAAASLPGHRQKPSSDMSEVGWPLSCYGVTRGTGILANLVQRFFGSRVGV